MINILLIEMQNDKDQKQWLKRALKIVREEEKERKREFNCQMEEE